MAVTSDNEVIFENAASTDKEFIVSEGATHDMVPVDAAKYPNVTRNFFDHLATWMRARF